MPVYWFTISPLSHLIANLKKAQLQWNLERRLRVCLRPAVLVIDEVEYMQLGHFVFGIHSEFAL